MKRRDFLKRGLAYTLAAGVAGKPGFAEKKPRSKPNVLYVFSDEHRACSLPGHAYNGAIAPNLARFAKENLSFRNCISNYPVCSPYRGMLLTGKWPYQSGIIDNAIQLMPNAGSIGETFQHAGYYTGYIGKWHLSKDDSIFIPRGPARQGFEDWHVWARTNSHFNESFTFNPVTGQKIQPRGYNCTLMTDQAIAFLKERKTDPQAKPWFLMLSWNPPHPPWDDAPPDEMKRYNPAAFPLRPNVKLTGANRLFRALRSETSLREAERGYFAHISAIDREFGRLLHTLEANGHADNTIVVYTSDHGEMMGSHGYVGKRLPWDESCKPPFFIRYPGVTPSGRESDIIFSAVDIYPSLCGLAGVPVPAHCVGHDLSAAMRGIEAASPDGAFLMHIQKDGASWGRNNPAPLFRGTRTRRYTYAVAEDGRWLLYDNREDPYQEHNLVADPTRARLMHEMDGTILDWLREASDPYLYASLVGKRSALASEG